jgi:hypothetical protein
MESRFEPDFSVEFGWRSPRLRANRATMSRDGFIRLVNVWCGASCSLLLAAILIRLIG